MILSETSGVRTGSGVPPPFPPTAWFNKKSIMNQIETSFILTDGRREKGVEERYTQG